MAKCKWCDKKLKKSKRKDEKEFCNTQCATYYRNTNPCKKCGKPTFSKQKICLKCQGKHKGMRVSSRRNQRKKWSEKKSK